MVYPHNDAISSTVKLCSSLLKYSLSVSHDIDFVSGCEVDDISCVLDHSEDVLYFLIVWEYVACNRKPLRFPIFEKQKNCIEDLVCVRVGLGAEDTSVSLLPAEVVGNFNATFSVPVDQQELQFAQ